MISTSNFFEPETKLLFSEEDIVALDELGKQLGKPSVIEAQKNYNIIHDRLHSEQDLFSGVERCAGESVSEMMKIVETTRRSKLGEGEEALLVRIFPSFKHYVTLMYALDADETSIAVDQFKSFLKGPPNHPTKDRTKVLLKFCLDYLDEVLTELWNE